MSIFLHHYPPSLFSEKIRVLLGYLELPWKSVIIAPIMPRPLLMPLSGGYRKTPIAQIGANVYCDSKIIAYALARHAGNDDLYSGGFNAHRLADWADTQLFQVTVALNFAPRAMEVMMKNFDPEQAAAFGKDRAELSQGVSITSYSPEVAVAYLQHYLTELDSSIGRGFLFGAKPVIADFSLYHCLWFVNNNPVNAELLEPYRNVRDYMQRMAAFGHGDFEEVPGEAALAEAKSLQPVLPEIDNQPGEGFSLGDQVTVAPVDYGRIPVAGTLVGWSYDEVIIERAAPETGTVMVHFPSAGFEVKKV